ncbi:MAG: glycoside hydrolase family 127 protein, partial [Pirellulales bacterium]|nr:glycoside hydrolase family 127 protein [Pirellulales bacterium]
MCLQLRRVVVLFILLAANSASGETPRAALEETPFDRVRIDDVFWSPRIDTVQRETLPDLLDLAEEQGKIDNYRIVSGQKRGKIALFNCPDSEIYKLLEAASYVLAGKEDDELQMRVDRLIAVIAAAQAEDGYLNTQFMLPFGDEASPSRDNSHVKKFGYGVDYQWRGEIADWPEGIGQFFCAGHLFEAAAAHYRATGRRELLEVAMKNADHIARRFPPEAPINYADHPQIGIGLAKLYEATGKQSYIELADRIVHGGLHGRPSDRGNRESWKPLIEQRKSWGHAVRINYLYAGATDLCRRLDRPKTRAALDGLWHSIVDRRIYLSGGVGGPAPHEQLADDWNLDNKTCYCECCANIAHGQWNHRLNLLHGDARYADIVEIIAYNAGLSGISLDGKKYFYTNLLRCDKQGRKGPHSGVRTRYLFCCPSKLPGFVAGIGRWIYAKDEDGIYVNLYIGGEANISLPQNKVKLTQRTEYPWRGKVQIAVEPERPTEFDLCLRIPGWVRGRPFPSELYRFGDPTPSDWKVNVNGRPVETKELSDGYLRLRRGWESGDRVELLLPMPVRRVYAHEKVACDAGKVALMRGPVVYCLEGVDHKDFSVLEMELPKDAAIEAVHRKDLLGGVTVLRGKGLDADKREVDWTAVPYHAWQNRGIDEMTVWLIE